MLRPTSRSCKRTHGFTYIIPPFMTKFTLFQLPDVAHRIAGTATMSAILTSFE